MRCDVSEPCAAECSAGRTRGVSLAAGGKLGPGVDSESESESESDSDSELWLESDAAAAAAEPFAGCIMFCSMSLTSGLVTLLTHALNWSMRAVWCSSMVALVGFTAYSSASVRGGFGVCLGPGLGGLRRTAEAGSGLGADEDAALRSGLGIASEAALGSMGPATCKVGAALGAETALDGSEIPALGQAAELGTEPGADLGLTLGPELGTGLAADLGCTSGTEAGTELGATLGVTVGAGPGASLGAVLGTDLGT